MKRLLITLFALAIILVSSNLTSGADEIAGHNLEKKSPVTSKSLSPIEPDGT
ncbi:hypothetical protein V1503_00825 [Bacillus sp. SCS-151]|uniref:hypothetical protein n=1 Tax=Nanhaiella sioensis TaxID=3115293 RepID=UPI00397B4EAF